MCCARTQFACTADNLLVTTSTAQSLLSTALKRVHNTCFVPCRMLVDVDGTGAKKVSVWDLVDYVHHNPELAALARSGRPIVDAATGREVGGTSDALLPYRGSPANPYAMELPGEVVERLPWVGGRVWGSTMFAIKEGCSRGKGWHAAAGRRGGSSSRRWVCAWLAASSQCMGCLRVFTRMMCRYAPSKLGRLSCLSVHTEACLLLATVRATGACGCGTCVAAQAHRMAQGH